MANLGTQEHWKPLTHTWNKAREHGMSRFTWAYKDGPHTIQLVFDEITPHTPGKPIAEMMLTSLNTTTPWSQTISLALSKAGNLFPTNAPDFDEYGLRRTLGIQPNPNTSHPWDMLTWITQALESSTTANLAKRPRAHDLPPATRQHIHEPHKIYYIGNAKLGGPTPKNLAKTRALIGIDAANYCQRHGRSTRWSPTPKDFSLAQWNQLLADIKPHQAHRPHRR